MMQEPIVRPKFAAGPLVVLALLVGVAGCMQQSFGTVQEAAKAELHLSDSQLGLVQGLAVSIPIAGLAVPIGRLIDRGNRMRLIIALAMLWSVGTLLTAFAPGFATLFVARMIAGLGATCAVGAAISIGADLCAPESRGRAMLILTIGKWAGTAAAFALAGGLYGMFLHGSASWAGVGLSPWRAAHLVLGILSLLLTVPALFLREPARHEVEAGEHAPLRIVLHELAARRAFLIPLFIGQIGVAMVDVAAGIWVAPVLTRDYGLTADHFGGTVGAIVFGVGITGSIAGGLLADRGQRGGRRGGILTSALAFAALGIPAALFSVMPSVGACLTLFGVLILSGTVCGLVTATAISVLIPNELRGVCLGAFIAIAGVIAFGIAPSLVTGLANVIGSGALLGLPLAIVGVVVGIVSALAFWIDPQRARVSYQIGLVPTSLIGHCHPHKIGRG
jgi:MFS family permease